MFDAVCGLAFNFGESRCDRVSPHSRLVAAVGGPVVDYLSDLELVCHFACLRALPESYVHSPDIELRIIEQRQMHLRLTAATSACARISSAA
jgi:hypothetical protein